MNRKRRAERSAPPKQTERFRQSARTDELAAPPALPPPISVDKALSDDVITDPQRRLKSPRAPCPRRSPVVVAAAPTPMQRTRPCNRSAGTSWRSTASRATRARASSRAATASSARARSRRRSSRHLSRCSLSPLAETAGRQRRLSLSRARVVCCVLFRNHQRHEGPSR